MAYLFIPFPQLAYFSGQFQLLYQSKCISQINAGILKLYIKSFVLIKLSAEYRVFFTLENAGLALFMHVAIS